MGRRPASEYTPLRQLADSRYTLARVMGEIARACVRAGLWRRARNLESEAKRLKQAEHIGGMLVPAIIDPSNNHDACSEALQYRFCWPCLLYFPTASAPGAPMPKLNPDDFAARYTRASRIGLRFASRVIKATCHNYGVAVLAVSRKELLS